MLQISDNNEHRYALFKLLSTHSSRVRSPYVLPKTQHIQVVLEANGSHQSISNSDNNAIRHNTRRNTSGDEVANLQVSLSRLRVFHHDGGHVGEA